MINVFRLEGESQFFLHAEENGCFELTEAQKQELDRRIQSAQQNPQAGRSWEEIKSEFLKSK